MQSIRRYMMRMTAASPLERKPAEPSVASSHGAYAPAVEYLVMVYDYI